HEDAGGKTTSWGNPSPNPIKSGSKSMQDGWGDKESSVAASRHSSWEDEEEGGGMWNSAGSQGSSSSWGQGSNGGWGQSQPGGDSWMSPINRQFSNMGLLNDDPSGPNMDLAPGSLQEKKMDVDKRGMLMNDYNGDLRKGGRGGGGMSYRPPGSKEAVPGDPGSYYDKVTPRCYLTTLCLLCLSHVLLTLCRFSLFFISPCNPTFSSRPLPFLPACQLLLQQQQQQPQQQPQQLLQNQRKFTPNVRQQADPQQLARIMAVLRQQQQQQQVGGLGGSSKLSPSHHSGGVGGGPKLPGAESLPHPGLAASMADLHQKTLGHYSGEGLVSYLFHLLSASSKLSSSDHVCVFSLEFQPGVPWKGIDRVDPESDPYMTPGSMMGNAVSPNLNDTEHQLLQDNTGKNYPTPPLNTLLPSPGAWPYSASDSPLNNAHNSAKYTDYKTSWPPEPIGHKSWKASRGSSQNQLSRPPPGLASQKQPSPSPWSGGAPRLAGRSWGGGSSSSGSTWSDGSSRESCWLVLSNLTPQIDGSTLRTICMQHGPLLTFHLGLTQGTALIRYSSKQEAAKAQSALHMCVLGNTTILAEFVSEEDVARYIAHSQAGGAGSAGASGNGGSCERVGAGGSGVGGGWSNNGAGMGGAGGVEAGRQGLWGGMGGMSGSGYPGSSLWGSPALEDCHQMGSPASLLPGDLLGGGADSI
uniref:Uncharacterized protein n=1 Tax=Labrus bergylta TaxID=56723 RepID=A0A3Q3E397_9LABR